MTDGAKSASRYPGPFMKHLVLGSSGFLGVHVVNQLVQRGHSPLCGRRSRSNTLALRRLCKGQTMVLADLDDPDTLAEAMAGVDVVIHAAGYYPTRSNRPDESLATAERQIDNVCNAAATANVRRLVYLSSTGSVAPGTGLSDESDVFPARPRFSLYHALKWLMEERVLSEQRFETSIACPGACLGPWDLRMGTSALLVALANRMDLPHPDGWVGPVDVRDAAWGTVELALRKEPLRRVLMVGENLRLQDMLEKLAPRYDAPPPSRPLSPEAAVALADAAEARPERPPISRNIVDLVVHGVPVDSRLSREALGLEYRPLSSTLDDWEAWARPLRIIPPQNQRATA
jgi:dihydroflavonol-4-reductase